VAKQAAAKRAHADAAEAAASRIQQTVQAAAASNQPHPGPHLEPNTDTLSMITEAGVGQSESAALTVVNTGSTAVYYSWRCHGLDALPGFDHHGQSGGGQSLTRSTSVRGPQFVAHDLQGAILPGETKEFR
jgi:hypothetical protein